jgi:hypothetical protein
MDDSERFRLLGKYGTPRFRHGRKVLCEVRGEVTICGLSTAPIPWSLCTRGRGRRSLVVFKDLHKAILRESNQAICHWWGRTPQTVTKWRKALGVERNTEGSRRLSSEYCKEPWAVEALKQAHAKAPDPQRRQKIAAARRGKARPPHVGQAVAAAHRGTHHSEETRRKMCRTHRRLGTLVPGTKVWTASEDELLKTLSAQEAVRRTGRTLQAVYSRGVGSVGWAKAMTVRSGDLLRSTRQSARASNCFLAS